MHLRLFGGRLSIILMRSNWISKIALSFVCGLVLTIFWWFGVQRSLCVLRKELVISIEQLSERKEILDEVLVQYQDLTQKLKSNSFRNELALESANCCKSIVDQARLANLNLQSYATKKLKNDLKQMIFTLNGDYQELLSFLHYLDQINLSVSCSKLHVATSGYRLQIAYVCGIHTSVK